MRSGVRAPEFLSLIFEGLGWKKERVDARLRGRLDDVLDVDATPKHSVGPGS